MERSKIGNHLTPWGRVIPDKLTDSQLVKKFPRAMWNSPHSQEASTCPYPEPDHYSPCLANTCFTLILSSRLY